MTHLRTAYVIAANTALLFLIIQFGTYAGLRAYDRIMPAVMRPAMSAAVKQNYAHLSPQDEMELLSATSRLRFRFEPGLGWLLRPVQSRFVNVDEHGIRANGPQPRPITSLTGAVWFLGGSTTFGEGIADAETIPAQLERVIGRPVVNLGVSGYDSHAENVLFAHYLRLGYVPALALFLDGINETCEPTPYADQMRALFDLAQLDYRWDMAGPVRVALNRARRKSEKLAGRATPDIQSLTCVRDGATNPLSTILTRTLRERDAWCRLYGIQCYTLVQPFAGTHGPRGDIDPAFMDTGGRELRDLFDHLAPAFREAGAVFVTDALDRYPRHPFIDEVHYSADASRVIAETLRDRVPLRPVSGPGTRE